MFVFPPLIFVVFCFSNGFAVSPIQTTTESSEDDSGPLITTKPTSTLPPSESLKVLTTTAAAKLPSNLLLPPNIAHCLNQTTKKVKDEYLCFLELREKEKWRDGLDPAHVLAIEHLKDPRNVYEYHGLSDSGIIIMAVIFALIILIGNGAALGYFFRWNFKPLSRRPTEDEMDDVLDADLPVMLINHEKRANEFQFAAKAEKDTQTIMANEPQQTDQQQSSMPSELKSVAPDDGNGGAGGGGQPPRAGTPRRPGGGAKRGVGGGRGRGRK